MGKGERGKGGKLLRRKYIDMLPCVRFEILLLSSEHLNIELNIVQEHLISSFPLFLSPLHFHRFVNLFCLFYGYILPNTGLRGSD